MKKNWRLSVLFLSCVSTSVFACQSSDSESEMLESPDSYRACEPDPDTLGTPWMGVQKIYIYKEKEKPDYWAQWNADIVDGPMVTADGTLSHVGFGIWQPNEDKEMLSEMAYSEWIMSHGLQLSLGLGEAEKAKFRLDYQWHEIQDDKLVLQVEVPF